MNEFSVGNQTFKAVDSKLLCNGCAFFKPFECCLVGEEYPCTPSLRDDCRNIIWVEVKE